MPTDAINRPNEADSSSPGNTEAAVFPETLSLFLYSSRYAHNM